MKSLFLGSVSERSGKTVITLGLAMNYQGKIGYFKPFKETIVYSRNRVLDQDAYLMKRTMDLEAQEEEISPFSYDIFRPVSMKEIMNAFEKARCDCDMMLVEGTRDITTGYMHDVSGLAIAQAIGADVVLVSQPDQSSLDRLQMIKQLMDNYNLDFKGAILNQNDDPAVEVFLEDKGINVLGSLPTMDSLKHFRVKEIVDALGAEVIVGEDQLDRPVEEVVVGAMTPESAIKYMRRLPKKAVITGGDRPDIQMAALSTDSSCLILSGGLYPAKTVISKAYELGVPMLLVRYDTLTAAEMVDQLIARIDPDDREKIDLIKDTARENLDLKQIYEDC